jgi:hypothetical protein
MQNKSEIDAINNSYDQLANDFKNSLINVSHKLISREDTDLWERITPLTVATNESVSYGAEENVFRVQKKILGDEKLKNFNHIRVVTSKVAMDKTKKVNMNKLESELKDYNTRLNSFALNDPAFTISITILGISDQVATKITHPSTFEMTAKRVMSGKLNIITFLTVKSKRPKVIEHIIDDKVKFLMAFVSMPHINLYDSVLTKKHLAALNNPTLRDAVLTIHDLNLDGGLIKSIED